jgi:hypothetical protein
VNRSYILKKNIMRVMKKLQFGTNTDAVSCIAVNYVNKFCGFLSNEHMLHLKEYLELKVATAGIRALAVINCC